VGVVAFMGDSWIQRQVFVLEDDGEGGSLSSYGGCMMTIFWTPRFMVMAAGMRIIRHYVSYPVRILAGKERNRMKIVTL